MSRKQLLQRMRQILLHRRDGLRRALASELGRVRSWDERVVGDTVDDALDADYEAVNSQLAEAESRELSAIEDALQRVRQGTYGICEDCGRNIPVARLQALPYASNCVACQRAAEQKGEARQTFVDWSRVQDASDSAEELTFDSIELFS
jgi:DnaK suppressor protein